MRGLIYRSQGCLVSPTSTVNTVILNLHPAKGSKLRNNYACLLRRGRRTPKGCMENILYGFEPRYTPPTRFPSRQIILRFEGGGQVGGREREKKEKRKSPSQRFVRRRIFENWGELIDRLTKDKGSLAGGSSCCFLSIRKSCVFFTGAKIGRVYAGRFLPSASSSTICLRIRNAGNLFLRKNFVTEGFGEEGRGNGETGEAQHTSCTFQFARQYFRAELVG